MQKYQQSLIYCALPAEAKGIAEELGLKPIRSDAPSLLPHESYHGSVGRNRLVLIVPALDPVFGVPQIGSEPAAILVSEAVLRDSFDLIINAGVVGALVASGLKIGDAVLPAAPFAYIDRKSQVSKYDGYLEGKYPVADADINGVVPSKHRLGTGSSLQSSPEEVLRMTAAGIQLKDMEAAAIARIAFLKGIPFVAVKVVSDLIDSKEPFDQQFYPNLNMCCQNLASMVKRVADAMYKS